MNKRCETCHDYLHPIVIRTYVRDTGDEWRTCKRGCTVRGLSVHPCWTEGERDGE